MVVAGQDALEELQDSMSETERDHRLQDSGKKGAPKKKGPSRDVKPREEKDGGKYAPGEINSGETNDRQRTPLYPVKELEALGIDSSGTEGLSSSEEEDLEEAAAKYEKERYHPDEDWRPRGRHHKHERQMMGVVATSGVTPTAPPAPPPYTLPPSSDSFLPQDVRQQLRLAYPIFEGAEGGRVHAPVEFIQIKELAEAVRKYGVSANFTISQVERLATLAMTPGDWQT
ncbi:igE-binding protein-like protein, partial [Leptotrombidium deliense]